MNKINHLSAIPALIIMCAMLGCSAHMPPDCNDDRTKSKVLKVVFKSLRNIGAQKKGEQIIFGKESLPGLSGTFTEPDGKLIHYRYVDGVFTYSDDEQNIAQRMIIKDIATLNVNKETSSYSCRGSINTMIVVNGEQKQFPGELVVQYISTLAGEDKKHVVNVSLKNSR